MIIRRVILKHETRTGNKKEFCIHTKKFKIHETPNTNKEWNEICIIDKGEVDFYKEKGYKTLREEGGKEGKERD